MKRRILCIPETRQGHGTGHIKRCLELLGNLGDDKSGIYLPIQQEHAYALIPSHFRLKELADYYDLVIIDKRSVSRREISELCRLGLTVGIDVQGSGRAYCDYIIDMLPNIRSRHSANMQEPGFLSRPVRIRDRAPEEFNKILVSFGGEDALGLSSRLVRQLCSNCGIEPQRISVLIGRAFHKQDFPQDVQILRNIQNAKEIFADYDLVICQFGLTMYEASAAGCAVAGLHPSRYHKRLADAAGFYTLGVRTCTNTRLSRLFTRAPKEMPGLLKPENSRRLSLPDFLAQLSPLQNPGSPTGLSRCNKALLRLEDETFFRCEKTRLIFKQRYKALDITYNGDYFDADYRKQYGKSYEEDFDKIKTTGYTRIRQIQKLTREPGSLLDMGCALGPFLQAAHENGWEVYGNDISRDAVNWVRDNLKLPAECGDILNSDFSTIFGIKHFRAISMWYVIEHIGDLDKLLRKINRMLEKEGIFAFSTPNGSGISARKDMTAFLENGPQDHLSVFQPEQLSKLLAAYGFSLEKTRITGHHPERFPLLGKSIPGRFIAGYISKLFGYGDTFEAYVRKTGDPLL
ncbi:methyltransferase domain-containing protein [Spirochaeta dissipatitropha]